MRRKIQTKKKLAIEIIILLLGMAVTPVIIPTSADELQTQADTKMITFYQQFQDPIIENEGEFVKIHVLEANSYLINQGGAKLPVFAKTFEFPWGTEITDIKCVTSEIKTMSLSSKIEPVPSFKYATNKQITSEQKINLEIYESSDCYPSSWFSYEKGAGTNKNGDHVLFLSLKVYPVRYISAENIIEYINSVEIVITSETPETTSFGSDIYDLVIIAPSEFSKSLEPLVDHKNSHNLQTTIMTLEEIYETYQGRDEPEQIKYFIKFALEEWGIDYVLLVGNIKILPIRTTYANMFGWFESDLLSDLYYADIYNETYEFCSWDANENDTFGEVVYIYDDWPPEIINIDEVDLYPDVDIGRLPCRNTEEVVLMVNKIITYEEFTYDQLWFKKIILVGGDTFPPRGGSPFNVFEGEITNKKVMQELPDFEHNILWASKRNLNPRTFNRAINKGAGFLCYSGHGFEHGWGTYRPNSLSKQMIIYFTPYLQGLRNGDKLPIVFFDACLTAKLDFNIIDLENYYPILVKLLVWLTGVEYDPSNYYPCFAWAFMNRENGGAIATIGATRTAYTMVDSDGVYAGAGYLDVHFFKAYEEGITLGEMFRQAQNDYINYVGKDFFTIEEFLILGDPSLMVGGYP